ncbi:MAG: hypothetical protein OSJ72_13045 [Lachnospiraceae bacterium]|nr:hypothetical protein [Lachnospiraceae bacterium]
MRIAICDDDTAFTEKMCTMVENGLSIYGEENDTFIVEVWLENTDSH